MKQHEAVVRGAFPSKWKYVDGNKAGLPGWRIGFRTGYHGSGVTVIAALKLTPLDVKAPVPGNGITGRLLGRLPLKGDRTAKEIRRMQKHNIRFAAYMDDPGNFFRREHNLRKRGRPRVRAYAWYKRFAARYRELGPKDKRTLEKEFNLTATAMRSAVWRCRHRYLLLEKTLPGMAGV